MADQFIFAMYFIAGSIILFAIAMGGIGVYGAMEEKRIYEEKVAKRNLLIRQQQKERDAREKKEREDYAKN
jgi:hypothetical protein